MAVVHRDPEWRSKGVGRVKNGNRQRIMAWVGSEILPHEAHVRAWLRRTLDPDDLEDVIQEAYCRISALDDVSHIRSGRAYLFTTARMLVLERIRRSRIVSLETVAEIESLNIIADDPSPERVAAGRRELARVRRLIEGLPDRCRRVVELRKIEGLSQREVAETIGVPEHTVENDVGKGLKLILKALADGKQAAETALVTIGQDERARDTSSDS
jgi:RNA polymerase sigma-70 factor (ECF subfamily)